jgi:dUTP pyrophosphatase
MNDSDIKFIFKLYKKGDKIGQIVIHKTIHMDWIEKDTLSSTQRSEGGFGSTGQ